MAKSKSGHHGQAHPVNWLAAEFGVERTTLARLLGSGVFTVRQAFEALSGKYAREEDRRRRQKAEADSAEIDAAEKRGLLMPTQNHLKWVRELGTRTRTVVMESKLSNEAKKALCAELARIKIKQ